MVQIKPLLVALLFLAPTAQPSTAQVPPDRSIAGQVAKLGEDGEITLSNGGKLKLWGLEIAHIPAARDMLGTRYLDCRIVNQTMMPIEADCKLTLNERVARVQSLSIDLHVWLEELGIAEYACIPITDNGSPSIGYADDCFLYSCVDGIPSRGMIVPEFGSLDKCERR